MDFYKNRKRGMTVAERLERMTFPDPNTGCFLFAGTVDARGYGRITLQGQKTRIKAHRIAWELENGPIPDGMEVAHRCDVTCCCNPKHLFLTDHKGNMHDMWHKGRARPRGVKAQLRVTT